MQTSLKNGKIPVQKTNMQIVKSALNRVLVPQYRLNTFLSFSGIHCECLCGIAFIDLAELFLFINLPLSYILTIALSKGSLKNYLAGS